MLPYIEHIVFNNNNVQGLASLFRSTTTLDTLILNIINDDKIERWVSTTNYLTTVHYAYLRYTHLNLS